MKIFSIRRNGLRIIITILGIKITLKRAPKKINTLNIAFYEKAGIGNRIFGLFYLMNYFKPNFVNVYWDDKEWISAKFNDIFNYEGEADIKEYNSKDVIKNWQDSEQEVTILDPPCSLKSLDGERLALKYNEISPKHIEEYKNLFQCLKPSAAVQKRLEQINLPENFVALQVRNNFDWDEYGRNENIELFYQKLQEFPKDTIFYLSAMNKEISELLRENFPNQIIELPEKDYSSMIDAAADLYILSKAENTVYSYGSTFSELAWWLSQKNQHVVVIGDNEGWK